MKSKNKQKGTSLALVHFRSHLVNIPLDSWRMDTGIWTCYKFVTRVHKEMKAKQGENWLVDEKWWEIQTLSGLDWRKKYLVRIPLRIVWHGLFSSLRYSLICFFRFENVGFSYWFGDDLFRLMFNLVLLELVVRLVVYPD